MADVPPVIPNGSEAESAPVKKASKALPTSRVGPQKQLDLLRAYVSQYLATGKPVRVEDAASIIQLHPDTARTANPFFVESGLLTKSGAGAYIPTGDVISYYRATEWQAADPAHKLQPTLKETWFSKAILVRLSFRAVDEQEAIAMLAEPANVTPDSKSQLAVILWFLETAGLITREGGVVRAARVGVPPPEASTPPSTPSVPIPQESKGGIAMRTVQLPRAGGSLTLSGDFNPFELSGDERTLVYDIIDKMNEFASKAAAVSS